MSNKPTPEFIHWWRNHREAGYCEDRSGKSHWNTYPSAAWKVDRFRKEYSLNTGHYYQAKESYTQQEFDKWYLDQQRADDFAEKHGFGFSCEENKKIWDRLGGWDFIRAQANEFKA